MFLAANWLHGQTINIASGDTTVCSGDTITLQVNYSGITSISWQPTPSSTSGSLGSIATYNNVTSTFQVIATGYLGSTPVASDTIMVNVVNKPVVSVTPSSATICRGDTVNLTPSGAIIYLWLPDSVNTGVFPAHPDTSTTIQVIGFLGGCASDTVDVPITVIQNPDVSFDYSTPTGCTFDSVEIEYIGKDSIGSTIYWTFQNGNPSSATGLGPHSVVWANPGNYEVTITVQIGSCVNSFTDTFAVFPTPVADAGPDIQICEGDSAVLNGSVGLSSGCVYQWTPFSKLNNPFIEDPTAFPDTTTTFYFQTVCNGCASNIDSMTLFVGKKPSISFSPLVNYFCAGSGGVQLNGSVSGGVPPYSFSWTPTIGLSSLTVPNPIANPPQDTVYKVVAIGANGCSSDTAYVEVKINELPVVDAGPDLYLCDEGPGDFFQPTILNPQPGGYTYTWVPGTGLSDSTIFAPYARPDTTTIYHLIVTNNLTGCSSDPTTLDSISYVVVHVTPKPIADAGPDTVDICLGDSVQLGQTPTGGGPTYTFEWTPALGLSSQTVNFPKASPPHTTTYQFVVISNGCRSNPDYITVRVNARPTVAILPVMGPVCPGDSVQLQAIVDANAKPPIQYVWNPNVNISNPFIANPKVAPLKTTQYKVRVTTGNCISAIEDSVLVQILPSPIPIADTTNTTLEVCKGDSVQLRAKIENPDSLFPVRFVWRPGNFITDTTIINPLVFPPQSTTYYLHTEYGACKLSDSVTVFVHENVSLQLLSDKDKICKGDTVRIWTNVVGSNPIYIWYNPGTITFDTPDSSSGFDVPQHSTVYDLEVINGKCSERKKLLVKVFNRPEVDFDYSDPVGCVPLRVSFKNKTKYGTFYMWDFGDSSIVSNLENPVHIYTKPGEYSVTLYAYSEGTCMDSMTLGTPIKVSEVKAYFVSNPTENTAISVPAEVSFVDSSSGEITEYYWSFGDGDYSSEINPVHTYQRAGNYEVSLLVKDKYGCLDTFSRSIYKVITADLDIPNVVTPNNDGINDYWTIENLSEEFKNVIIYDRWGNKVYYSDNRNFRWEPKSLPEGQYFYVVNIGNTIYRGSISLVK